MATLKIIAADDPSIVGTIVQLQSADLTVGREPDNALVLTDPLMSRRHARFRPADGSFVLEDLGSSNGVLVNDQRVAPGGRALAPGDRIQIGRTVLVLEAQPAAIAGTGAARCAGCGRDLETDARFCPACGAAVQPAPHPAPAAPQAAAAAASPARRPGARRRWPLWLALGLGLAVIGGGAAALLLYLKARPGAPDPSATAAAAVLDPELRAAVQLRVGAVTDWHAAVRRVATPAATERLAAISETIWPDPRQTAGWVYLLETALICPGAQTGNRRPVAFYHPWSDVFLVTVWEARGGAERPRLVDVELLMGDFVRKKGQPRFETGRPAAYQALYQPLSIGLWAGQTVRAYEAAFNRAAPGGDWRAAIPTLRDEELLQVNRVGAGLQIAANMGPLGLLALPAPEARGTRQVRAALKRLLQEVRKGQTAAALSRGRVLKETREELARLPFDQWERFKPVGYSMGPSRSLLLLSRSDQTDRYLALLFARGASEARLERVDLLSFNVFYRDLDALKRRVGL